MDTATLLADLISIPSPFFHETEIAEHLESALQLRGFTTHKQPVCRRAFIDGEWKEYRHYNVLGEKGTGSRSFLLYGHMDTVPVINAWAEKNLEPFKPLVQDGRMYGLGACDMKAGIAAILKAVEDIEPQGYKIKICFGVDEENDSWGAVSLVNSDFIKDCAACIVPEVGSGTAKPALNNLVIGRHGRVRAGVRITGRAAHASTPEHIINPIEYAYDVIREAKKIDLGSDPDMPPSNLSIAGIHAMGNGLSSPEECIVWFDALFSPPRKVAELFDEFESMCRRLTESLPRYTVIDLRNLRGSDSDRFTPRLTPFNEPWKIDPSHPLVTCASEVIREVTGKDPVLACGKSNADENYIGQLAPTIVIPPIGGNEHQGGEWVDLASVDNVAAIIRKVIFKYPQEQFFHTGK